MNPVNNEMNDVNERALQVLEGNKVAIFIVAYNAEKHIRKFLSAFQPGWPNASAKSSSWTITRAITLSPSPWNSIGPLNTLLYASFGLHTTRGMAATSDWAIYTPSSRAST